MGVWEGLCFGFFPLPYFQVREAGTFHAIECKLHPALEQTEHFNMYHFTLALLPSLNCAFSLTGFLWPSSHQRHFSLTDTIRVVVAGGAGQSDPDDSMTTEASVKTAWTLCDSSGEAFLTRGLATAAPCSASAPAARRCTLELVAEARRGHERT